MKRLLSLRKGEPHTLLYTGGKSTWEGEKKGRTGRDRWGAKFGSFHAELCVQAVSSRGGWVGGGGLAEREEKVK